MLGSGALLLLGGLERASGDHLSYVYDTVNSGEVKVEIFPENVLP